MSARTVAILPAPTKVASEDPNAYSADSTLMPYACQTCARRKIKCDRVRPLCSSCSKGKLQCAYQAPPRRQPKRKRDESIHDRLARYERTLQENGFLAKAESISSLAKNVAPFTSESTAPLPKKQIGTSKTGRLLSGDGKARCIDGNLWRDLGGDEM
jgi:Fungal Zn(2)-Cys(6) binuclear cluster domain